MSDNAPPAGRLIFFDNLRYLFVLFVVAEHSAHTYDGLVWWAVAEPGINLLAGWLAAFSDVFAMPLLFYIAGYFALPNLQKKGVAGFVTGKLKRLGIPWLICILVVTPIFLLIYHYTRDGMRLSQSYLTLWLEEMHKALQFNTGFLVSTNQFSQHYMWFLSLLLLFFFLFALIGVFARKWLDGAHKKWQPKPATATSALLQFAGIGLATSVLSVASVMLSMNLAGEPEPWFMVGNLIQFRVSRILFYVIYFALGVATYRNKWLERGRFPGSPKVWAMAFAVLLPAFSVVYYLFRFGAPEMRVVYAPIYFLVLNFLCAACLGLSVSLGKAYWNQPRAVDRSLAANSYNIYLSHYVFVMCCQLILLPMSAIPHTVKYIMVVISSGLLAYASSRWLITPHPRLAAASAFALLFAMFLFVR